MGQLGYRPALSGFRGIAIALVVGLHAFGVPAGGALGVDLFFVLSGFLITTLLLEEHSRSGTISLRGFYARRARRLLPALSALLVMFVFVGLLRGAPHPERTILAVLGASTFSLNAIIAWGHGRETPGLGHLWSLSAEDQFYFIWPTVCLILFRSRRWIAGGLLLALIAAMIVWQAILWENGTTMVRISLGPDTRGSGLLIGCLLALGWNSSRVRPHLEAVALIVFPFAVLVFALLARGGANQHPVYVGWTSVFGFACAAILVRALKPGSWVGGLLALPPLVWLGSISYSLYLWHYPILVSLGFDTGTAIHKWTGIALSLFVAAISYRFVEQPFLRRGQARRTRIADPAAVPA